MPGITPDYQQHRQTIGNHTRWLDNRDLNQKELTARVNALARNPGAHSGNRLQQANALALLQLITLLSAVGNSDPQPAITAAKADARPFGEPLSVVEHLQDDASEGSTLSALYNTLSNAAAQAGQFINDHDPFTFPVADAHPQPAKQFVGKEQDERIVIEDIYGTLVELSRNYYEVQDKTEPYQFIKERQKAIDNFYKDYASRAPKLRKLATRQLKNYIKRNFKLNINPADYYFLHFNEIEYKGRKKIQHGPPDIKRSLPDCLFTNFNAHIQDNLPDMDAMCGIYHKSMLKNKRFDANKALAIKPVDFINAIWQINFYQRAIEAINKFFANDAIHIKKLFLDFVDHLNSAKLISDAGKDVLNGINLAKDRDIAVSVFDIDGYHAANAFVFENKATGRHTLYFPHSDFKFKTFENDIQMRVWVRDSCGDKNFREMLEKHFSLVDRQDGPIFSGVDSWVNSLAGNPQYYDKIARKPQPIEPQAFFSDYVRQIKEKMLSDADSLIKSDKEVTRDMWENGLDAFNSLFYNPLTAIPALALHIEHAVDADTLTEKMQEWEKLKTDAVNIATLVAFSNVIKLPEVEGYEFIESVKKGINTEIIRRIAKFSEMEEVYASESLDNFDKEEMLNQILFGDNPEPLPEEASLDDLLPPDDVIELNNAGASQAAVPPGVAELIDENNPFQHIPPAGDPYTLDEVLELDEIQSFAEAYKRDEARQLAGDAAAGKIESSRLALAQAVDPAARAISVPGIEELPYIREFLPIQQFPVIRNMRSFDRALGNFVSEKLLNHPWDLFMGIEEKKGSVVPQYIRVARSVARIHTQSAENMIHKARLNLVTPELYNDIKEYFRKVLSTTDDAVTHAAVGRFVLQVQRVTNFIYDVMGVDYNNIVIISTRQIPRLDLNFGTYYQHYSSITDINYLKTLSKAFIAKGDPYRRIFIMYDALPEFDVTGVDIFGRRKNNLESAILHEMSHLAADTKDFYPNEINPQTYEIGNGESLLNSFQRHLASGTLSDSDDFKTFLSDFCQHHKIPIPKDEQGMLEIVKRSPILQANIMAENADNFVAYVKDIGNMHNPRPPRMRKIKHKNEGPAAKQRSDINNNPGLSGLSAAPSRAKRNIHEQPLDVADKHNGITFTSAREHYPTMRNDKRAHQSAAPQQLRQFIKTTEE